MAFSVCVANSDDPPRKHGFLLTASGWRLAPGYDMNPEPWNEGSQRLAQLEREVRFEWPGDFVVRWWGVRLVGLPVWCRSE
ncbi:MAG: hypothetical protein ACI89E_000918 [Planctomycetota bacterium]|jgi:hypothetical protein